MPDEVIAVDLNDSVAAKAAEISARLGVKVHPLIFRDEETSTDVIGFMREPNRVTKLRVLDKSITVGVFSASAELYDAVIIKEESDSRLFSELSSDDKLVLGATMAAYDLIKTSVNQFKKK
jgi:hypothetical protein